MSTIYLDNAATTKVRDEIVDTMSTIIKNEYGNPSSTLVTEGLLNLLLNYQERKFLIF